MKKFLFLMVAVLAIVLTSCSSNKKSKENQSSVAEPKALVTPLFDGYALVNQADSQTGIHKFGLQLNDKVIIEPAYRNVVYDPALDGFKCYSDNKNFVLADMTGHIVCYGNYETAEKKDSLFFFHGEEGYAVYNSSAKKSLGIYNKIDVQGQFVFYQKDGKWGVQTFDGKFNRPNVYSHIFIVNFKNMNDFAVASCQDDSWELTDQSGAYYNVTPLQVKQLLSGHIGDRYGLLRKVKF